jgi:lipoprotein-releasing system ATP-binding protein
VSVEVRVAGLRKAFLDAGRRVEVLRGVDLEVAPGELVAVVGPSGSGKSTLLHLLGGLDAPDAGSVEVAGHDLATLSGTALARFRNRTLGFVFQFHQLLPDFTALENVMLPGRIAGRDPAAAAGQARVLLGEVGLAERLDHFPNQLSGGERQRVALCRALLLEPPLLLADEPTGNLDPATGEHVFELLRAMAVRHGTTMVLVTHNPELARRCARIYLLEDGILKAFNDIGMIDQERADPTQPAPTRPATTRPAPSRDERARSVLDLEGEVGTARTSRET